MHNPFKIIHMNTEEHQRRIYCQFMYHTETVQNVVLATTEVSEWMIRFNSLSGDSVEWGPYSPYKPCNHSIYIEIIIFPHIDNTIYRPQLTLREKGIKNEEQKKWEHPLTWQIIGGKDSGSLYIMNLQSLN